MHFASPITSELCEQTLCGVCRNKEIYKGISSVPPHTDRTLSPVCVCVCVCVSETVGVCVCVRESE